MSNVEPEQPGVIDSAFLARLVPLWTTVSPETIAGSTGSQAGTLTRDEALVEIRQKLAALYPVEEPGFFERFVESFGIIRGDQSLAFRDFETVNVREQQRRSLDAAADLIVDAIPTEQRTPGIVAQLNVVPYVNALVANTDAEIKSASSEVVPVTVLAAMAQAQQLVATETAAAQPTTPGVTFDPETGQPILAASGTIEQSAAEQAQQIRIGQRLGGTPVQQLLSDGTPMRVDLTNVVEPTRTGRVPSPQFAGFAPDPVTGAQRPLSTPTTQMPMGAPGTSGVVTVTQAADFLYSLARREVEQLQDRMKAAGYFTQQGFDEQSGQRVMFDVPFERGYSDDQATTAAWIAVLTDALGQQRSVDEVLRIKSMDFERRRNEMTQTVRQERQTQFTSSLAKVRELADEMAIETLGRRLNPEEFVGVREYVRRLQRERVGTIAGRTLEPWMTEAPEMGVTQEELGEQVGRTLIETEMDEPGGNIWDRLARKYLGDGTS